MRLNLSQLLIVLLMARVGICGELRTDFAIESDPEFPPIPAVKVFPPTFKPLWLQALQRSEADVQRLAAETVSRAHLYGFPGMLDAKPLLLRIVESPDSHPTANAAAVRALITLDAREYSKQLLELSKKQNLNIRQEIEPALAKWRYEPAYKPWRDRFTAPDVRFRDLLLAIRCSEEVGDPQVVPQLLEIVNDPLRIPAARLAAARACGSLRASGLLQHAENLTRKTKATLVDRHCALGLMVRHDSPETLSLLSSLAVDPDPSVVELALKRMLEINPDSVLPLALGAMSSSDPMVRRRGVEAFVARPNVERVSHLVQVLGDAHPQVRSMVREALFAFAKNPEFDGVIRDRSVQILNGNSWMGQEQAILLLASLDHEIIAPRLVELLTSTRGEVLETAAWGLRKIQVKETLPAILARVEHLTHQTKSGRVLTFVEDSQLKHLFEAMGLMNYGQAESVMRSYIPKLSGFGSPARMGAIYGLGYLHVNDPEPELTKALFERATDTSLPSEFVDVQVASAISLGRMRAKSVAEELRKAMGPEISPTQPYRAIRWAYIQITGKQLPEPIAPDTSFSDWFLTPLDVK